MIYFLMHCPGHGKFNFSLDSENFFYFNVGSFLILNQLGNQVFLWRKLLAI